MGKGFLHSKPGGGGGELEINGQTVQSLVFGETITKGDPIYKTKTFTKLGAPDVSPDGPAYGCSFSPNSDYLAIAHGMDTVARYISIYKRNGDTFTKLADPATLPTGDAWGCAFSPDGTYLAVAHSTSPFVTIYKRDGDTFTKLPNPATLPTGLGRAVCFSPDGTYLVVAHDTTPFFTIYKRSGDTFTKLSNPSGLPTTNGRSCVFSNGGTLLVIGHEASPYFNIYRRSGDTFTKFSFSNATPGGIVFDACFSPDDSLIVMAHSGTIKGVTIYKNVSGSLTKLSEPGLCHISSSKGCSFHPSGTIFAVSGPSATSIPRLIIYKVTVNNQYIKYNDPSSLPSDHGCCRFSPDGIYLAVVSVSSRFNVYKLEDKVLKIAPNSLLVSDAIGYAKESGVLNNIKECVIIG